MFLVALSEASVGLSLSIYRWKALPVQNMNMQKYFNHTFLKLNLNKMKNMHFCPKGLAVSKISQQIIWTGEIQNWKKISKLFHF